MNIAGTPRAGWSRGGGGEGHILTIQFGPDFEMKLFFQSSQYAKTVEHLNPEREHLRNPLWLRLSVAFFFFLIV